MRGFSRVQLTGAKRAILQRLMCSYQGEFPFNLDLNHAEGGADTLPMTRGCRAVGSM